MVVYQVINVKEKGEKIGCFLLTVTEDIGYYDYRPVTLLFACFISFQCYALS